MIDLHIHTTYSDGTDSVADILKIAKSNNLTNISITDHNTCGAYTELDKLDVKKYYKGNIIKGVELSTIVDNYPIEILGYNIDVQVLTAEIEKMYISPEERNKLEIMRLFDKAILMGINVNKEELINYDSSSFASKYFHSIVKKDEKNKKFFDEDSWKDSNIFYRKYMSNPNTMLFVDTSDILPDINMCIDIVKKAGGLVFIPHIFEYRENANKILETIIKNYKIDGIECYYTTFSKEQTNYLLNICEENNLFISGGSDYHGTFKKNVYMGKGFGDLEVPDDICAKWPGSIDKRV